jgi:site-specific recombinase XerD
MHDVLEDMRNGLELRGLSDNTVKTYLRYAGRFVRGRRKPLQEVGRDDVCRYLLRLKRRGVHPATRNMHLVAIRTLFSFTLHRPEVTAGIRRARVKHKVPLVLSGSEVERVLEGIRSVTHRAMVAVLYGAGLRVSEMCRLRICDVDSKRMRLLILEGKSHQRYARLTPRMLRELRAYFRARRPKGPYLFPGQSGKKPVTRVAVAKTLAQVGRELGLRKRLYPHALRHSYAVHSLELGADLRTVQLLLGHQRITSTTRYLHLSQKQLARAPSPLDTLGTSRARPLG